MRTVLSLSLLASFVALSLHAQEPVRTVVNADGLVAHLFRPGLVRTTGRRAAVLLVGGSGGGIGWQDSMAVLLSRNGFTAMALAYFGVSGLPPALERIPLEYVERALKYLRAQPDVDTARIGMGGVSKGGELTLLFASMRPEIHAVAAFVPSGVVFQSIADGYPRTSSWTYHGRDVPFVPYGAVDRPANIAEIYRAGLEQASRETLEAATISVERINGPLLLLSGRADTLWPSTMLCEMVVERLRGHAFPHPFEHVAYADAGHLISSIRDDATRRGGTVDGNARAQRDGRRRFLEFFERYLDDGR